MGFSSRDRFLKGDFTFQWGGIWVSVEGGLHFYVRGEIRCPIKGIGFDGRFSKKIVGWEAQGTPIAIKRCLGIDDVKTFVSD